MFIAPNQSIDIVVPANQSIIVSSFGAGTATLSYSTDPSSFPTSFYEFARLTNAAATYGPFAADRHIRIAGSACQMEYEIGVSPKLTQVPFDSSDVQINGGTLENLDGVAVGVPLGGWSTLKAVQVMNGSVSSNGVDTFLTSNAYFNGSWRHITEAAAAQVHLDAGTFKVCRAPVGDIDSVITWADLIHVGADGDMVLNSPAVLATAQISVKANAGKNVGGFQTGDDLGKGIILLNAAGTAAGSITWTATTATYATSSDYRLKNDVQPMTGALASIMQLKPVTYSWKGSDDKGEGFIAHELSEVCALAVTGEKDGMQVIEIKGEDGDVVDTAEVPAYQGIDTSFLVARLVAAMQELKAEFDTYKAAHP